MSSCPTCGQTTTDDDDERTEEAPAETGSQMMNRRIRQRANRGAPLADLFTRGRRPDGDEAA